MAALPVRIPEKVLAWRERQRKGSIMKPRTFKRITKQARKRYGRKRAGPATGGKAYWITTLRKYLNTHPGDLAARRALNKLVQRRYGKRVRKNPRVKWYVGADKVSGLVVVFRSTVKPTRKGYGRIYKFVVGPFESQFEAEQYKRKLST